MWSGPEEEGRPMESAVCSAHDIAAYILNKCGPMSAMKLQKLVYYCQAWSLVWDERPLFHERIEAWANGPVVPELYAAHKGMFIVDQWPKGSPDCLDAVGKETVDAVLGYYASKPAQWLSDLTHDEAPWKNARAGLGPGEPGSKEITWAALAEYYGGL
jgi:uncharacterized phage-associated protein